MMAAHLPALILVFCTIINTSAIAQYFPLIYIIGAWNIRTGLAFFGFLGKNVYAVWSMRIMKQVEK